MRMACRLCHLARVILVFGVVAVVTALTFNVALADEPGARTVSTADTPALDPVTVADELRRLSLQAGFSVTTGRMTVVDSQACSESGDFCYGSNPASPYLVPSDSTRRGRGTVNPFTLARDEALVIIGRTPPEVRYYATTTYLYDRPKDRFRPRRQLIFGSLYDSLNINTLGYVGDDPFNAFTVIVVTPNRAAFDQLLRPSLEALSVPQSSINVQEIPESLLSNLGSGRRADRFTLLIRAAYPSNQSALDRYLENAEQTFQVLKIDFSGSGLFTAYPTRPYSPSGTGQPEPGELAEALGNLVDAIEAKYSIPGQRNARIAPMATIGPSGFPQPGGQNCIEESTFCVADNPDARYFTPLIEPVAEPLSDSPDNFWIVVGVDHVGTGKATYVNTSLTRARNAIGLLSISDAELAGSAAYHSGLPGTAFPNLYAYMFARDCSGVAFCSEVLRPSDTALGARSDDRLLIATRVYLDPATNTGPDEDELTPGYVLLFEPERGRR